MKLFKNLRDLFTEDTSVNRHAVADATLLVMTKHHYGNIPAGDVIAIFEEVEDRLTSALIDRQAELTHELKCINEFLNTRKP
jgi:hypothetical protein